jgi:uncharacterized protein YoxC
MTVTISYTAFLLTILVGVGVAALVYFMTVMARISRTVTRLDTVIDQTDQLLGSLKTLAEESTATVISARHLIDQGNRVVADVSSVSARMRDLAESDAGRALSLLERLKSFAAIFAGVRTAFTSVRDFMERRRHAAAGDNNN